ncbi:hypothetical protein GCM10011273_24460 [Asticcacaulis endophyticus]|uniref:Uncharacterized protein n=1 Tax=Asticcacaulis endophyticus TaxID=1395890 RepID=A0A918Q9Y8_9CAUL|nr:hypothetical protein GCM10011273_24460 [Asticcacaulis endophyticus]
MERDGYPFQGTHQPKAKDQSQGQPNHHVNPDGRLISEVCNYKTKTADKACDQNNEDDGTVSGIRRLEILTAIWTIITDFKKA